MNEFRRLLRAPEFDQGLVGDIELARVVANGVQDIFRHAQGVLSVEGRTLEKVTSLALLQSAYCVLSFFRDSQKTRSSASLAKSGTGWDGLLIDGSLLPAHVARGDGTNERPVPTLGEGYVQPAIQIGPAQRMESRLALAVLRIFRQKQKGIEKDLFHFRLSDAVLFVLSGVALVAVKGGIRHRRPLYMSAICRPGDRLRHWLTETLKLERGTEGGANLRAASSWNRVFKLAPESDARRDA